MGQKGVVAIVALGVLISTLTLIGVWRPLHSIDVFTQDASNEQVYRLRIYGTFLRQGRVPGASPPPVSGLLDKRAREQLEPVMSGFSTRFTSFSDFVVTMCNTQALGRPYFKGVCESLRDADKPGTFLLVTALINAIFGQGLGAFFCISSSLRKPSTRKRWFAFGTIWFGLVLLLIGLLDFFIVVSVGLIKTTGWDMPWVRATPLDSGYLCFIAALLLQLVQLVAIGTCMYPEDEDKENSKLCEEEKDEEALANGYGSMAAHGDAFGSKVKFQCIGGAKRPPPPSSAWPQSEQVASESEQAICNGPSFGIDLPGHGDVDAPAAAAAAVAAGKDGEQGVPAELTVEITHGITRWPVAGEAPSVNGAFSEPTAPDELGNMPKVGGKSPIGGKHQCGATVGDPCSRSVVPPKKSNPSAVPSERSAVAGDTGDPSAPPSERSDAAKEKGDASAAPSERSRSDVAKEKGDASATPTERSDVVKEKGDTSAAPSERSDAAKETGDASATPTERSRSDVAKEKGDTSAAPSERTDVAREKSNTSAAPSERSAVAPEKSDPSAVPSQRSGASRDSIKRA